MKALDWYNGWCIYGSCCQLELFQASQFIDRSSKIKVPTQEVEDVLEIPTMPEIGERQSRMEEIPIKGDDIQIAQDSPRSFNRNFKAPSESVLGDSRVDLIANGVSKFETPNQKVFEDERSTQTLDFAMVDDSRDWKVEVDAPVADLSHVGAPIANAIQIQFGSEMDDVKKPPNPEIPEPSKVNFDPSETPPVDYTAEKLGELVVLLIELMEIRLDSAKKISRTGLTRDSVDSLGKLGAHKVFVKMPKKGVHVMVGLRVDQWPSNLVSFGMRSVSLGIESSQELIKVPYDRGKSVVDEHRFNKGNLIFYPGRVDNGSCRSDVGLVLVVHPAWDVSVMGQSPSGREIDLTLLRDGLKSFPFDRGQTGLREESMSCCLDSSKGGFYGLDVDADGSGGINIKPSYDQRSCISVDEIANSDLKFIRNGQAALPFDRGKNQ